MGQLKWVIEYIFCVFDFVLFYSCGIKFFKVKSVQYNFLVILIFSSLSYFINTLLLMSEVSELINIILLFSFSILIYEGKIRNIILFSCVFYLILGIYTLLTSISWQTLTGTIVFISNDNVHLISRYSYIVIFKIIAIMIAIFISPKSRGKIKLDNVEYQCILFVILSSLCIVFMLSDFLIYEVPSQMFIYIVSISAFFSAIVSLIIVRRHYAVKLENNNILLEKKIIEEHSNQIVKELESDKKIYKVKHDMNNLFITARELLVQKKYDDLMLFFDEIVEDRISIQSVKTIDTTVNAIINSKMSKATDIKFIIKMEVESREFNDIDITILLGNALDNAIEAASNAESKVIYIYVKETINILLINIKNTYDGSALIYNKDGFTTTKLNKEMHGLGIASMKSIVEKYSGIIEFEVKDKTFEVSIVITN